MNIRTTLKYAALVAAMAIPAVAQNSSVRDLANMASVALDAARERSEQAGSPEAVKAIFAKAEEAAEEGPSTSAVSTSACPRRTPGRLSRITA